MDAVLSDKFEELNNTLAESVNAIRWLKQAPSSAVVGQAIALLYISRKPSMKANEDEVVAAIGPMLQSACAFLGDVKELLSTPVLDSVSKESSDASAS